MIGFLQKTSFPTVLKNFLEQSASAPTLPI